MVVLADELGIQKRAVADDKAWLLIIIIHVLQPFFDFIEFAKVLETRLRLSEFVDATFLSCDMICFRLLSLQFDRQQPRDGKSEE